MTPTVGVTLFDTQQARAQLVQMYADVEEIGDEFAGIGLLFCINESDVPHIPMYQQPTNISERLSLRDLTHRARKAIPRHDGFHLMAPDWTPLECNAYLFCRMPDWPLQNKTDHGSRYLTALICSSEPPVLGCLIVSSSSKCITLFQDGVAREILDEKYS